MRMCDHVSVCVCVCWCACLFILIGVTTITYCKNKRNLFVVVVLSHPFVV